MVHIAIQKMIQATGNMVAPMWLSLIHIYNGAGGTYDCIAIMSYYVVCKPVTSFRDVECF